jgi:hypothetical protein
VSTVPKTLKDDQKTRNQITPGPARERELKEEKKRKKQHKCSGKDELRPTQPTGHSTYERESSNQVVQASDMPLHVS